MAEFAYVPDHADKAVAEMPSQDRTQTAIVGLVQGLAGGVQVVEDLLYEVSLETSFQSATGRELEQWGEIAGQPRAGLDDATYRRFIEARMIINTGVRNTDETIGVWGLVTGPTLRTRLLSIYPRTFEVWAHREDFMDDVHARAVARTMDDQRELGAEIRMVQSSQALFGFSDVHPWAGGFGNPWSRLIT